MALSVVKSSAPYTRMVHHPYYLCLRWGILLGERCWKDEVSTMWYDRREYDQLQVLGCPEWVY